MQRAKVESREKKAPKNNCVFGLHPCEVFAHSSRVLQTIFSNLEFPLIALGIALIIVKQIGSLRAKKKPVTPRAKSMLWFLQAFGFWCLVVGVFMVAQVRLPDLLSGEVDPADAVAGEIQEDPSASGD